MSWKRQWGKCKHPRHEADHAKFDKDGEQDGWTCWTCGYHVCKYCGDPHYSPCPKCGAS